MSEHLSREEIENYIARDLAPAEILRVDDHLAACGECMLMIDRTPQIAAVRDALKDVENDRHLSFETMSKFVDGEITDTEREIANVHMSECSGCSETVGELRNVRAALDTKEPALETEPLRPARGAFSWWKFLIPAAAAVVVGIIVWDLVVPNEPAKELSNTDTNSPVIAEIPIPQPGTDITNSNEKAGLRTTVASINDAGGRIEIDSEGRLRGISADQFEPDLKTALMKQTINISPDVRQLKSSAGTLMGPSAAGVPFRLIGPVGRVVEMDRPPLRWGPMQGAESYKVGIYDENFRLMDQSPELKTTLWKPDRPLARGRIYQWQVTATVDGKEIVSPSRPAAEAKFKVLDAAAAAEIQRARQTARSSHLLMGIVYAKGGMIAEAEREFHALLQKNPNSEIARRLLAKIRSAK